MKTRALNFKANTTAGRVLLALRAGGMDYAQIIERLPQASSCVQRIKDAGLVDIQSGYYVLTEAGRRVCPSRRPAAGATL